MQEARLSPNDLEKLTFQWEVWATSATTTARKIVRARLHLLFLLFRYGGLRLREALELNAKKAIDTTNGMICVKGASPRDIMLPIFCMKHIRRILSLPEADSMGADFLRFDQGFVRRKCYEVARPLGLDKTLVGPRALRYARGLELLETHVPFDVVRSFLGQQQASHISAFLDFAGGEAKRIMHAKTIAPCVPLPDSGNNIFIGIVTDIRAGQRAVCVEMMTFSDICLQALYPHDRFLHMELHINQVITAAVEPEHIILSTEKLKCSDSNCVNGILESLHRDKAETFVVLTLSDGTRMTSIHETTVLDRLCLREKQKVWVLIPSRQLHLFSG